MARPVNEFVAPPAKELMSPPVKEYMASAVPMPYCAAVLPVFKSDPAGLGAGTMSVKTTSQGVLQYENRTHRGGLRPGKVSSEKVRIALTVWE